MGDQAVITLISCETRMTLVVVMGTLQSRDNTHNVHSFLPGGVESDCESQSCSNQSKVPFQRHDIKWYELTRLKEVSYNATSNRWSVLWSQLQACGRQFSSLQAGLCAGC